MERTELTTTRRADDPEAIKPDNEATRDGTEDSVAQSVRAPERTIAGLPDRSSPWEADIRRHPFYDLMYSPEIKARLGVCLEEVLILKELSPQERIARASTSLSLPATTNAPPSLTITPKPYLKFLALTTLIGLEVSSYFSRPPQGPENTFVTTEIAASAPSSSITVMPNPSTTSWLSTLHEQNGQAPVPKTSATYLPTRPSKTKALPQKPFITKRPLDLKSGDKIPPRTSDRIVD